ncbi:11-beta-hydroxysteroid dehydrogenase A-like [Actinidia eriantha]|uniref:11-beta-hydroxysteroid dehydrogenase A-like n=1 Tax=Actinidia eriantha TaxID=165200 RepID=UPI0025900260|nr:11-beta-hydroxysteroid dehydrogenase A-like [Actinidia eriantha]
MDLIHMFLNLVASPFTFFSLMLFLPPFQAFKWFLSFLATIFSEDVYGKVVLITGASSGIGEHLAYEYAKRGACLAICARRVHRLLAVAERARDLGSPDVISVEADVARVDDCRRFVEEAVNHFGRLDHVVCNAGITHVSLLEEVDDITHLRPIMEVNLWGSVYTTRFTAPHLRETGGKIVAISSSASWLPAPRMSVYNASKAAMAQFFETLRIEFGPDIHITLVTPGFMDSELTQGKYVAKDGKLVLDQEMRDVQASIIPVYRAESCAKAIVNSACRGERYVTAPAWFGVTYLWKVFCPELIEWAFRFLYLTSPGESPKEVPSKKIHDLNDAKSVLYPETVQTPELKTD